jgi:hypothetical protein
MPDSYRPSNAPLSESEADRLSERFTASWDEAADEAEPVHAGKSGAFAATSSPPPVAEPVPTLPLPEVAAVTKPKPKPTLLGIAPIVIGPSSAPPPAQSAPPPAPPAPLPAPASKPLAAAPDAVPPPPPSSPDSSVARGLTTPAKPYVPKDDPSTPAVVISDAPAAPDRTRIAQTIPGQTRSSPLSSPVSIPPPVAARAEVEDTYPPLRGRSKLPFLFGGLAVLGVAAFAIAKLNGEQAPPRELSPTKAEPSASPPPAAPTVSTTTAESEPAPSASAAPAPSVEPKKVVAAPLPEPKPNKAVQKKPATSLPPTRKATKAETKSASEPGSSKKGVIVRETPF